MNGSIKNLTTQKLTILTRGSDLNNWQNIAVCDNYLIIKDNNIQIFEIDLNTNTANFLFEIRPKEELIKIISIDKNNVFFFFSTSIVKFDIQTKSIHPVQFYKLINDEKIKINTKDITSIYFNEKIKLSFDDKNYYFGLMTLGDDGELLISKEISEDKGTGVFEIVCESVRSFLSEAKHVELKVFSPKDMSSNRGSFFITVITNTVGWFTEIRIPDVNDYHSLVEEFKKTKWEILFDMSNIAVSNIFYSFYYDTNYGYPVSFIAVTDNLKMKICEFSTERDETSNKLNLVVEKETEINFEQEIKNSGVDNRGLKIECLVGTYHYNEIVYVAFKNRIFLYDIFAREMLNVKKYESEFIREIYINDPSTKNDKQPFYHLYFLSNRNVYYSKIETNFQKEFYRTHKLGFNINDSKGNEDLSLTYEDRRCRVCKTLSTKRCAACRSAYYCSEQHQEYDWSNHKKNCTFKDESQESDLMNDNYKVTKIDIEDSIVYTFPWEKARTEIMSLYRDRDKNPKNFMKGIDLCYNTIQKNREFLSRLNQNTIKAIKTSSGTNGKDKDRELFYKNLVSLYKLNEDYFCNILLLIYGFLLKNNKNEGWRILNKVLKEIEDKEFVKYLDLITEYTKNHISKEVETPKTTRNSDKDSEINLNAEIQSIFLHNLQLLSTIAKIFFSIGEFSSYENWMILYIERLEKVYHGVPHGNFVIANAYLLMANLYVELDNLGKAILLYTECINLIGDPKDNREFLDLYVAANYNLGIVFFVTDQYYNAKLKLEVALRTKRDIKNEELSEQTAIIYETIGEIEIEYKNFTLAFTNLQKANDIRSKLPNINDKKSKMKINILLDYIYQNLDKENDKKFYRKGSINANPTNAFATKDEKDFDDLMNFIRSGNEEKNEIMNKRNEKQRKVKYDIDVEELEKFFLFMTKLSSLQIQVLNSTQLEVEKNMKMPIFFSPDFKNCLNHHQRLEVNNLKVMSLRRNKILKNPHAKIDVENLNYDALHAKNTQNNLSSIKNYFVVNKILRNWEVTKKYSNTNPVEARAARLNHQSSLNANTASEKRNSTLYPNARGDKILDGFEEKKQDEEEVYTGHSEKNIKHNKDLDLNKKFNFDQFKSNIRNYCKEHMPAKEELLDDNVLLFLSQKLGSDELETLMENPEFVFEIMEEYAINDSASEDYDQEVDEVNNNNDIIEADKLEDDNFNNSYRSEEDSNASKDKIKIEEINSNIPKAPKIQKVPFLNSMNKIDS